MRFARIQGHGRLTDDRDGSTLAVIVTLDDGRNVRLVRDEPVAWIPFGPPGDVAWQIDQYTQETIGRALAEEGWEVLSQDETAAGIGEDGMARSSLFVARRLAWD